MPNWNSNSMEISRLDKGKLTKEEIGAFIREAEDYDCLINGIGYKFSYQYVIPVIQDEHWRDNNIDARSCKWDGFCGDGVITLNDYKLFIDWDSPRSPPYKWLQAVCKKFPELYIKLEYDEPGAGFQGEMGRDEEGQLFDNYRDGDEYLYTCEECEYHYKYGQIQYRKDIDAYLCDDCYKKFLACNKK